MHTKDRLAKALTEANLPALALRALTGEFDDFQSEHAAPQLVLVSELALIGTPGAMAIRSRVIDGEFDATDAESEAWGRSEEGQAAMASLLHETQLGPELHWFDSTAKAMFGKLAGFIDHTVQEETGAKLPFLLVVAVPDGDEDRLAIISSSEFSTTPRLGALASWMKATHESHAAGPPKPN